MPLQMDVHGFLHDKNAQSTREIELAEVVAALSRGATLTAEKRAAIDRNRNLSPEGRGEAKRKVGADWAAHAETLPGADTTRRLRRHVTYQEKQIRDRVWPPRLPEGMGEVEAAAVTREIRDRLNSEPDRLKRKFLLDAAARDADGLFFVAVRATPRAFPLYPADDIAAATETYVNVAQGNGPGVRSLRESQTALGKFDTAFARAAMIAGASIDVGQGSAQPAIQRIEADG